MTDFDKGGKVEGAKAMPPRHVAAANNEGTNNDAKVSESVAELHRQGSTTVPNAAGGPGEKYGTAGGGGSSSHASYRKGG